LFRKNPLKSSWVCALSQKNANISAQSIRILDPRPVLETSLNSNRSFERRE
jgi:hypothetical protein